MLYPFLCGAFHQQEEDDDVLSSSRPVCSSPRRSCRRKKNGNDKNPYSTRGLDQFSALLAELEEKRQQIYSQMGTEGIVRFVYKNSNDCVPVVVKLKDQKKEEKKQSGNSNKVHHPAETKAVSQVSDKPQTPKPGGPSESDKQVEKKKSFSWNVKSSAGSWRRPYYYVPAVTIFILLLLACFGRSVAILFTCVTWYMVPVITGKECSNLRSSMKKKDFARKLSGNKWESGKLSSPKSSNKFGAARDKFP